MMLDQFGQPQEDDAYWQQFQPVNGSGNTGVSGYVGGVAPPPLGQAGPKTGIDWDMRSTSGSQSDPNLPPPPAEWPQAWKDLYTQTGGTGGINPPWLHPGQGPVLGGSTTPTGGSGQRWDQNYFMSNFGSPKTPQELIAMEQKIVAAGGKVLRNASGVAGKIQTPDGRIIDVINAAGAGGNGFQWLEGGGGSGGGQGSALAGLGYNFGDAMKPLGEFTPPTEQDALNSPGLQYALNENNRMLQNGAAAKGTLLNGRFQQALGQANIGAALQGYDNVYQRAANTFGINYGVRKDNRDSPFSKNLSLAQLGKPT